MSNLWKSFVKSTDIYCRYLNPENFNYSINISLKYAYLYVETPKTGCSSIKSTLQKMELGDPQFSWTDFEDLHKRDFSPLLRPQQVGDFNAFIARQGLFKFCFSRNPYTRFLSCYLDKIRGNKQQKVRILKQLGYGQNDLERDITFGEFTDAVIRQPVSLMDPHWRHQYYQTFQDNIHYDFIGKFEQFDAHLEEALGRITPDYHPYLAEERRHSQDTSGLLADYYTDEIAHKVYTCFEKDFRHFGYARGLDSLA